MRTTYVDYEHRAVLDIWQVTEEGVYHISRINVPPEHRGKGIGSRLLDEACVDADREGVMLSLCLFPSGGLDYDQLKAWYERRGFVEVMTDIMERTPKIGVRPLRETVK